MKLKLLSLYLIFALIAGCKTREDIEREKLITNMNSQMQDGQKLNADFTVRLQNLEDRLSTITGQVEEGQHQTQVTFETRLKDMEEKIKTFEANQEKTKEELDAVKQQMDSQGKYLEDVLSNLKSLTKKGGIKSGSSKKTSAYDEAMEHYQKGRYKSAKTALLNLLEANAVSGAQKARTLHNLGLIAYMDKNNQEAIGHFSQLFTEFPKSGYNKRGLLFLGKCLQRLNKGDEAKSVLQELVTRFPDAKQVGEAKKLISKL